MTAIKSQLTELILDSLRAFHTSRSTYASIRRLIEHSDILYSKGLYNHCKKLLNRAEKKANRTAYLEILPEIFNRKRLLLLKEVSTTLEEDLDAAYLQNDIALSSLMHTSSYLKLMDFMQIIAVRYAARPTDADMQLIKKLANHPLLQDETQPETFGAQMARYSTLGAYALLTDNITQAEVHYRNAVLLWKQHPVLIQEYRSQYRAYLLNYLNCILSTPDEKEFATVIHDIKTISFSFPEQTSDMEGTLWNIELLYYLNRGGLDRCADVITDIEKSFARRAESLPATTYLTLCHNCAIYYFLMGRYSKSLEYINNILNERRIEIKRDIHDFARVISLLIHYELHHTDILDNMLRSAKRFLRQRETSGQLEHTVMNTIHRLLLSIDNTSAQQILTQLYRKLATYLHTMEGPEPPGLTELLFWVESKLCRRPVATLFTEKMRTNTNPVLRHLFPVEAVLQPRESRQRE